MRQPTILIIGAGICGLSIGWEALRAGATVKIYEKNLIGSGATNRSGGMLAAGIENEPSEALLWDLTRYSQSLWASFRKQLEAASGVHIDYQTHGTMMVATNQDDKNYIDFVYGYQRKLGVEVQQLSAYEIKRREPHLKVVGGIYCSKDHQVDSSRLSKALATAIEKGGGSIYTKTAVEGIRFKERKAIGITLSDTTHVAGDKIVVCAGVHCQHLGGIDDTLALRPLKGQMLALHMPHALIRHVVWTPRTYLIPQHASNRLIIGATVEEKGFDNDNTAGGILSLLTTAWRALPAIEDLALKKMWTGHRPTTRDDAPILGKLHSKNSENTYIATGHHRNGILLAPATAKIMVDLILEKKYSKFLDTFSVERFKTCT